MEHDEVVITSDNQVGTKNNLYRVFAGRVTIPEFEVFSSPKIHISDIKTRRFNVIDSTTKQVIKFEHETVVITNNNRVFDNKRRRFNVIDRAVQKARQEIMNQEDATIFAALDAAGKK
jgi:uncharacterized protein (UPF0218 family)